MAAFYLCIVGAAIGASELCKEGPDGRDNVSRWDVGGWYPRDSYTPDMEGEEVDVTIPTPATPMPAQVLEVAPAAGVEGALVSYPWPYNTALRVAKCENAYEQYGYWRPGAIGGHGERGIMQIADVHIDRIHRLGYTWDDMLKVEPNIAVAYDIWAEQGWTPWSCY